MDPGNWATDLAGGAVYGYALFWVILASNLMAMLLQTLCARLGLRHGQRFGAGVPRLLQKTRRDCAVDFVRNRHYRLRFGRSHRLGGRAEFAVWYSACCGAF